VRRLYIILKQICSENGVSCKFHQNRPSFIEDIAKTFWSVFGHTVVTRYIRYRFYIQVFNNVSEANLLAGCAKYSE